MMKRIRNFTLLDDAQILPAAMLLIMSPVLLIQVAVYGVFMPIWIMWLLFAAMYVAGGLMPIYPKR